MEKLVFKGIESIVISENIVYYIYDVRKLDITLAGKKLRDKSIVYLYTADEGDVQINIIGSSKSIDTSSMTNGKCYKLMVNATSDIDFEELNEANEGGGTPEGVVRQVSELPDLSQGLPDGYKSGDIVQYIGATTNNTKTGHFYKLKVYPAQINISTWTEIQVQTTDFDINNKINTLPIFRSQTQLQGINAIMNDLYPYYFIWGGSDIDSSQSIYGPALKHNGLYVINYFGTEYKYVCQFGKKCLVQSIVFPQNPSENEIILYLGNEESYVHGGIYEWDSTDSQWTLIGGDSSEQTTVMTNTEFESAYDNGTLPNGYIKITDYKCAKYYHGSYNEDGTSSNITSYYPLNYYHDSIIIKNNNGSFDKKCKIVHDNVEYEAEFKYYLDDEKEVHITHYGFEYNETVYRIYRGFYVYKMYVNSNIFPCNIFCDFYPISVKEEEGFSEDYTPQDFFGFAMNDQNYSNCGLSDKMYNNIFDTNSDIFNIIPYFDINFFNYNIPFEICNNIIKSKTDIRIIPGYYWYEYDQNYNQVYHYNPAESLTIKDNIFEYASGVILISDFVVNNKFDKYSMFYITSSYNNMGSVDQGIVTVNNNIIGYSSHINYNQNGNGITEFTYNKIGKLCDIKISKDSEYIDDQYILNGDGAFNCNEVDDLSFVDAYGNVSYCKIGKRCDVHLRQGTYDVTIGDYCRNLYAGMYFKNCSIGNDYVAENNIGSSTTWTIGNNVENCHIGNGCNSIRFGDNCGACSIGDNSSYINMGGVTYSVHIGADCRRVSCIGDYCLNSSIADHARNLSIQNMNYVNFKENATGTWRNITYGIIGGGSDIDFIGNTAPIENIKVDSNVTGLVLQMSSANDGDVLKNIHICSGNYSNDTDILNPLIISVNKNGIFVIGFDSNDAFKTKYLMD